MLKSKASSPSFDKDNVLFIELEHNFYDLLFSTFLEIVRLYLRTFAWICTRLRRALVQNSFDRISQESKKKSAKLVAGNIFPGRKGMVQGTGRQMGC